MFFKKKKSDSPIEKLAESLIIFVQINKNKVLEKLSYDLITLPNFKLTFEYETFSIFIIDYCIKSKIKDPKLKDLILESFYSKWDTYFSDGQFRILKLKLDMYHHILKEYKDEPTIIQNFSFMFSRNVLKEVDLTLTSRLSEEYAPLKSAIEKLIDESKINESE